MLIQINITIPPGGSAGPFDLYSDANGYTAPFETQVPAASLTAGYIVELPVGATIIRVCSVGTCENCIDIPTNCPTTTTTSTSTSTTTSTSSTTTTTTTTAAPPYEFTWELITGTPTDIGNVKLRIFVDTIEVVTSTINPGNTYQSGILFLTAGQVVTATIGNVKTGIYNFDNKILKDGSLYQPQDSCTPCVNELTTPLFSPYTMGSADTIWIFQGDVNPPTTTTTSTSSTTTTTTSTSSTTTTTTTVTPLDCALNGPSAVRDTPATTTTTTTLADASNISAVSDSSDACPFSTPNTVYIDQQTVSTLSEGDIVYTDVGMTSVFAGGSEYWKVDLSGPSFGPFSAKITDVGVVLATIELCIP